MKSITLIAYKRPTYTHQVLNSLMTNNCDGYELFIGIDPGFPEVLDVVSDFIKRKFIKTTVVNPIVHSGGIKNNLRTYGVAFDMGSTLNIALEDDTPLAPDAVQLANWFEKIEEPYLCLNYFSWSTTKARPDVVIESNVFCPWGYVVKREMFRNYFEKFWMCDSRGWDHSINKIIQDNGLKTLEVVLSRSWNIGRENGLHYTPPLFDQHFPKNLVHSTRTSTDFRLER